MNLKDGGGRTPLFIAVEQGSLISTLALLEAGADPFVVDDFGKSILDCQADKRVSGRREREQNTAKAIELVKAYQQALAPSNK